MIGTDERRIDLRVAITGVGATKMAAVACHESQLTCGDPHDFLKPGLMEKLLSGEWFTLAYGPPLPPGAGHPFAGLQDGR